MKVQWHKLKNIDIRIYHSILDDNPIGNIGCQYLPKAKWDQLETINIGTNILKKLEIGLRQKGVKF